MSFRVLISMTLPSRSWFGSISLRLLLSYALLSPPAAPLTSPPFLLSPGDMHAGGGFLALLLPLLFLLGADRGLAVLHGRDGSVTEPHHPQALLVSWMGWGSWVCETALPPGVRRGKRRPFLGLRSREGPGYKRDWCSTESLAEGACNPFGGVKKGREG